MQTSAPVHRSLSRSLAAAILAVSAASASGQPKPEVVSGAIIVLNKAEASVSLLNASNGDEVERIAVGTGPHEVAVSPDGTTAVVCNYEGQPGNTLSVIDLPTRKVVRTLTLDGYHRPHGIDFLSSGAEVLVTVEQEQTLLKVDIATGEFTAFPTGGQQVSHMVVASADGSRAFVANIGSGTVSVIDLVGGAQPVVVPAGAGTEGIDLSPDGRELWVSNRDANSLSIIDTKELKVVKSIDCAAFPIRLKFTPDGAHVLVSCMTSSDVAVFDAATRQEVARIDLTEPGGPAPSPIGIVVAPDGARAFVACSAADKVAVLDTADWSIVGRYTAGKVPDGMGFVDARARKVSPR